MPTSLSSAARCGMTWTFTNPNSAYGDASVSGGYSYSKSLANGTAASQADRIYLGQHTIAASGTLDLDLAGSLTDVFGSVITFARVKAVLIVPASTSTASGFKVGAAAVNQFYGFFNAATDAEKVDATGVFFKSRTDATAWPVTAGTGDLLRVTNLDAANAAVLNVAIVGCSA